MCECVLRVKNDARVLMYFVCLYGINAHMHVPLYEMIDAYMPVRDALAKTNEATNVCKCVYSHPHANAHTHTHTHTHTHI